MLVDLPENIKERAVNYLSDRGYLPYLTPHTSWCVAGGFLRGITIGVRFSDIDIFVKSDKECHTVYESIHPAVDLVEVMESTPLERVKRFDFTNSIAAVGMTRSGEWWGKCHEGFLEACNGFQLVLNENWNGVGSVERIKKFLRNGWTIEDTELGKMMRKMVLERDGDVPVPQPTLSAAQIRAAREAIASPRMSGRIRATPPPPPTEPLPPLSSLTEAYRGIYEQIVESQPIDMTAMQDAQRDALRAMREEFRRQSVGVRYGYSTPER